MPESFSVMGANPPLEGSLVVTQFAAWVGLIAVGAVKMARLNVTVPDQFTQGVVGPLGLASRIAVVAMPSG